MRTAVGWILLALGGLTTCLVAWIWWMRATADVGEPYPIVYILTAIGPLAAVAGALLLRRRPGPTST